MNSRIRTRLVDARSASIAINGWVQQYSFEEMTDDLMIESAIMLQFERIGQALRVVREIDPFLQDKLPDINQWIGLRHRLVRDYREIDLELLWASAVGEIPMSISALSTLLDE